MVSIPDLKVQLEKSRHELSHMLDMMPEDKMEFRPGEQAKSAAELVRHLAGCEAWQAELAQKGSAPFPPVDLAAECKDKERLKRCLDEVRSRTLAALDAIPSERLAEVETMPWGEEMSIGESLCYMPYHEGWHSGQIAYIQTILGIMGF